jgi:hypothetical protein
MPDDDKQADAEKQADEPQRPAQMDPEPTPVLKPVAAEELQQAEATGQDTQAAHAQGQSDLSTAPAPPQWTQDLNKPAQDEQQQDEAPKPDEQPPAEEPPADKPADTEF